MATPAAVLNILLTANTAQANAALAKTQAQLTATSRTASATSATMKKAMGGIVVAAGAAAYGLYKIGEEFDDAYDKIRVGTGATGKELKKLETSFKNVVQDVPASFEDASTAIADLNTRMGLSGKPLERMTKQVTELSRITKTDVSGNVESISKAFVDWEVKTKDMGKTLDGFFRISQESGASVDELTEAVQKFGSPLRQLGFDLDEAASMWATFVRAGVNTQTMVPGLKLALAALNAPTDDLRAKMEDLGIAIGKPEKGIQQVFDLLGNKSTLSQIDKTTLAMEVFGKRAGADMAEAIKQGRFEVEDMLKTFRNGNDTIRKAGRDTMDLGEQWQQFTNILKVRLQPVAEDVFKGLGDLMKDVTKAFKADGWEGVFDLLLEKLNDALPKIQDVALKIGGKLAEGIVKGFQQAPVLTTLFVGGAMLKMFGGGSAIGSAGKVLGRKFGGGFGAGLVLTGVAAFAQLYAEGKRTLEGHGSKSLSEMFEGEFGNIGVAIRKAIKQDDLAGLLEIQELLDGMRASAVNSGERVPKELKGVIEAADDARQKMGHDLGQIIDKFDDFTGGSGKMEDRYDKTVDRMNKQTTVLSKGFGLFGNSTAKDMDKAGDATRDLGKRGSKNFDGMRKVVDNLEGAWSKGLDLIGGNTKNLLSKLKVNFNYDIAKGGKSNPIDKGASFLQRGGPINMGAPSGDTVPAMLERGEYVLNRNAVKALGKDKLDAINFGAAKRFQVGGMAGLQPGISRLAQWAGDRYGLRISSGLRSGAAGASWHNTGEAVDLVPPSMGATEGIFRAFKSQLEELFYDPWGGYDSGQMIGAIGGHMDHIHAAILGAGTGGPMSQKLKRMLLTGPDGPLQTGGQKALDMARSAANKFLAKHSMSAHGDIGIANVSGPLQAVAQRMIEQTWGGDQWPAFNELVTRESGWDPSAVNPSSGAAGLAQALPPSKYPPGAWPYTGKSSAVKQLEWMISYISGRYGTPSAALSFHDANNWYREGGIVGMQSGGSVDHIQDLYGKLAHADSAKRRKKIENRIKREQRDLKKAQGHRLHKKLGRIKDNEAMSGITAEVNKRQEAVDVLTDYIGRIETQHGFTQLRDVSAILEEAGIDPNVELGTLTKDQQDALTNAVNSDVAVEKGEINAEIALNYKKLVALFELRSQLIAGIEEAKERIAKALQQMEQAANAEEQARKDARKLEHSIGGLQKNLENLREKDPPARGKHESKDAYDKRIKRWRQEHQDKAVTISDRIAKQRFALSQAKVSEASARRIGETAKTSRDNLSSTSSGYLDSLNTIQGLGSPMGLNVAGAPMGAFGGEIFAVQAQLKSLGATSIKAPTLDFTPPDIPDADIPDTPGSSDSELTALKLAEALDTIRRLNVGITQNGVFQGAFATGGVVPGKGFALVGERGPELMAVNGGERVYSNSDTRSMLSPEVRVVIEDNRTRVLVDGKEVEAIVDRKLNTVARSRSYAGAGRL